MVLCKHFQQGYCRFGSKCNFEHIDIKQLVKNDIEAAINGKQYPFSCYGPFKDKPCIPNFIEDQSFEEVRLLCLEARQKNYFDQFHQQLSLGAAEAMNKMKALLQPSYEVINILTMLYDAPVMTNSNVQSTNSFRANNKEAGSTFGKSISTTAVGNNVFGGSIFSGGANANNNVTRIGSTFGGQQNNVSGQSHGSIFAQQPQGGNMGSIFSGAAKHPFNNQLNVQTTGGSGLFGQTGQHNTSLGQPNQFVQPQHPNGIFGQSNFVQQQQNAGNRCLSQAQPQSQNLFGQTAQIQQNIGTNIFTQAMQHNNTNAAPPHIFFQQAGQHQDFQQQQMQQHQQQFISQQPQDLTRSQNPQQTNLVNVTNSLYSKLESLSADEVEAFRADSFQPGKIPHLPPPIELLN